jgi:glycosyltransferase involved in cell wall biosynthesis
VPRTLSTFHVNTERGWRGGEQQMLLLMEGLRKAGHGVSAVCQEGGEAYERLRVRGFDAHAVPMHGEADPIAALALGRRIGAVRADVVHCHTSHAHTLGVVASRLGGRPAVVVSRRVDFSIYRNSFFGLNGVKYRVGVDRIVCVSDAVRRVLVEDGVEADRLKVVRDAVDAAAIRAVPAVDVRTRLGLPKDSRVVLAVGALVGHKGHEHLVAALPTLVSKVEDAHVVIAGEGPLRAALEEQARALWVQQRLSMPGYVNDVHGFYRSVDALVMPSVEEGLGSSVLEALCVGLPVVVTSAGGLPEIVRDGIDGLVVPPRDPSGLAAALTTVLTDSAARAKFAAAGPRRVDGAFGVDRMVRETIDVYEEVLRARRSEKDLPSPI